MGRTARVSLCLVPITLLAAAYGLTGGPPDAVPEQPGVVQYEEDDLLYTYHVLSGTEGLFDTRADPRSLRNLLHSRPGDARHLRRHLEQNLHVGSLEDLREERRSEIEALRSLGYL